MKKSSRVIILLSIFIVVFTVHLLSPVITAFDSRWSIATTISILREGNTDLDEYLHTMSPSEDAALEVVNGHVYTIFPIGVSILALPFVYLLDLVGVDVVSAHEGIELVVASFIIAFTAIFIYLIAKLSLSTRNSLLITFIFAFCTSAWSVGSRGLWQHGPTMLFLALALYLLLLARKNPGIVQFVSLPLALSFVVRPTNAISIGLFTVFIFIKYRHYFIQYVLWALPTAIIFLLYNWSVYHALFSPYYIGSIKAPGTNNEGLRVSFATFLEALAGNSVSPGRGLFSFTPIFLFSIWGMVLKVRASKTDLLDYFLIVCIGLHTSAISLTAYWYAGVSFGPRYFSDMVPYFTYFLIPVVQKLPDLKGKPKPILIGLFALCIAFSFFVHFRGATAPSVYSWNEGRILADGRAQGLWDWWDWQFFY